MPAKAESVNLAVATNFIDVAKMLTAKFESETHHNLHITSGSTGKLYAQIMQGAPFDVFLAADQHRPKLLEENNKARPGSRFTYATGRLVLWARRIDTNEIGLNILSSTQSDNEKLAMANPRLAPYGLAAQQVLNTLVPPIRTESVYGENVGQAYALVATGNASFGFVALSQIKSARHRPLPNDTFFIVEQDHHDPIRQDAVLLQHASSNQAAIEFLEFLQTSEVRRMITAQGYSDHPVSCIDSTADPAID